MKLFVVEGLDGSGKDFLIDALLKKDKHIYHVKDNRYGVDNLNEEIKTLMSNKNNSLFSLLEYIFMRKIEEAYSMRDRAEFAITSRFSASTYAYQVFSGGMDCMKFERMNNRVSDYADYYGVQIEYIYRDIDPENSNVRIKDNKDNMDIYCMQNARIIREGYSKYFNLISPHYVYVVDQLVLTDKDIEELKERIEYKTEFCF